MKKIHILITVLLAFAVLVSCSEEKKGPEKDAQKQELSVDKDKKEAKNKKGAKKTRDKAKKELSKEAQLQGEATKLYRDKKYSEAITKLDEAISANKDFLKAYETRAKVFAKLKEVEKAKADINFILNHPAEDVTSANVKKRVNKFLESLDKPDEKKKKKK